MMKNTSSTSRRIARPTLSFILGLLSLACPVGERSSAQASNSIWTSVATSPGCRGNPGCSQCGGCTCTQWASYCSDSFTDMPPKAYPGSIKSTLTMPFKASWPDDTPRSCTYGGVRCGGGTTQCIVGALPVTLDNILTQWDLSKQKLGAQRVNCKYYTPRCNNCCLAWSCSCYSYRTCTGIRADGSSYTYSCC